MADFMFVKDAAALWNISERQVSGLCRSSKAGTFLDDPDNCRKAR